MNILLSPMEDSTWENVGCFNKATALNIHHSKHPRSTVFDWLSQFPDLNPVANLWKEFKINVGERETAFNSWRSRVNIYR